MVPAAPRLQTARYTLFASREICSTLAALLTSSFGGGRFPLLAGSKDEREEIIATRLLAGEFDICVTSYEICIREKVRRAIIAKETKRRERLSVL